MLEVENVLITALRLVPILSNRWLLVGTKLSTQDTLLTIELTSLISPTLASPSHRIIRTTNVKQVMQYIKIVYELLLQSNAFNRARQLVHPGNRHAFAERLDKDIVQASLASEKRIKRYGEPEWSVALDQSRKKLTILRKCLSMHRTGLDLTPIIQTENAALQEPMTLPTTKVECCIAISAIKTVIVHNIATCIELREAELKKKIQALDGSNKKSDAARAAILCRMQRAEAIKQLFKKLRSVQLKCARRGVVTLEIPLHPDSGPKTCTEWRTIEIPEEKVANLQSNNRKHFGQAHGFPFTVS
jgi:hypothetical protein